jgi:hypothetical protein
MGELHLVLFIKYPGLSRSLCCPFCTLNLELLAFLDALIIYKLILLEAR